MIGLEEYKPPFKKSQQVRMKKALSDERELICLEGAIVTVVGLKPGILIIDTGHSQYPRVFVNQKDIEAVDQSAEPIGRPA